MSVRVRLARSGDADAMCAVINPIIRAGGTTAHQTLFDAARMQSHYITHPFAICCHVALKDGVIAGFQSLEWPDPAFGDMPADWALIASFVATDAAGSGIGRRLFSATRAAAKVAGVRAIDATIRADNASGLGYYGAMGFTDYDRLTDVPLSDGTPVDRIRKSLVV